MLQPWLLLSQRHSRIKLCLFPVGELQMVAQSGWITNENRSGHARQFVLAVDPYDYEHISTLIEHYVRNHSSDPDRLADVYGQARVFGDVLVRVGDNRVVEWKLDCRDVVGRLR